MKSRDIKGRFIKKQKVKNQRRKRKANIKTTREDGMEVMGNVFKIFIYI